MNQEKKIKKTGKKNQELVRLKKLAQENLLGWQKERASFENYRKRMEKRNLDLIRFANEELLVKILPILDNFDQALKHVPKGWEKTSWVEGIEQIRKHFLNILETEGVTPVKLKKGNIFDPALCEALEKEERKGQEKKTCKITEVMQPGYLLNGKLIRPARVKVC